MWKVGKAACATVRKWTRLRYLEPAAFSFSLPRSKSWLINMHSTSLGYTFITEHISTGCSHSAHKTFAVKTFALIFCISLSLWWWHLCYPPPVYHSWDRTCTHYQHKHFQFNISWTLLCCYDPTARRPNRETGTRYLGSHRGTPAFWAHIFISCESIFNCLAERGGGAPSTF